MHRLSAITQLFIAIVGSLAAPWARAQVPASPAEAARYSGLLAAASRGDAEQIRKLTANGNDPNLRNGYERTPLAACRRVPRQAPSDAGAGGCGCRSERTG